MCFSAEVSFGSGAILTTIGVLSIKSAKGTKFRAIAFIPFLFGIQQFAEGMVWLGLTYSHFQFWTNWFTAVFIIFAWVIWPAYIPLAFWKAETHPFKKKLLRILVFLGVAISIALFYVILSQQEYATVQDCSIHYGYSFKYPWPWIVGVPYIAVTILPCLLSSLKWATLLGVFNTAGYFASKLYWEDHVISVWCFFAAVSSVIIYFIIKSNKVDAPQVE